MAPLLLYIQDLGLKFAGLSKVAELAVLGHYLRQQYEFQSWYSDQLNNLETFLGEFYRLLHYKQLQNTGLTDCFLDWHLNSEEFNVIKSTLI